MDDVDMTSSLLLRLEISSHRIEMLHLFSISLILLLKYAALKALIKP